MDYYIATRLPGSGEHRCALNLCNTDIAVPYLRVFKILEKSGFRHVEVNLIEEARRHIGRARYSREAKFADAPSEMNCITFIKLLYANRGIWLPYNFLRWLEAGQSVEESDLRPEDIVFTAGFRNRSAGTLLIGHVAMVTGEDCIIHADYREGIREIPRGEFFSKHAFSAARRLIPQAATVHTYTVPEEYEVETSDDILYFVEKKWREENQK